MDVSPEAAVGPDTCALRPADDDPGMPLYERPVDRGARRGRFLANRTAAELLIARRAAGISQREIGRLLRISHSSVGKAERGEPGHLTIELAAKMAAVLGLEFSASLHPDGDPVRDRAHLGLLERFRQRLTLSIGWRTKKPMTSDGDRRSANAMIEGDSVRAMI